MTNGTDLKPATLKIIESIESDEIQELLRKGIDPREAVEGWYYALALNIWKLQEGKHHDRTENIHHKG